MALHRNAPTLQDNLPMKNAHIYDIGLNPMANVIFSMQGIGKRSELEGIGVDAVIWWFRHAVFE